ncbi:MAG: IclR family transcriptional regulator [Desulfomonilaceae bacterium]
MKEPTGEPKPKSTYSGIVPAVEEASRVLITLARNTSGKMTLTQIRREVGIHNSKAFSILNTLQRFGFVQKDPVTKTYSLGMGLIYLSQKVLDSLNLREAASPFLSILATGTNSTAFLGLITDTYVYVAAKDEGSQAVAVTFRIGQRFPLFWGTHGKAILAFLPEQDQKAVLTGDKLSFRGHGATFDLHQLEKELTACRKSGYAVDLDEIKVGIRSVAAPVFGPTAKLIGAFVVIGTFPVELMDEHGRLVAREAWRFSQSMGGIPQAAERSAYGTIVSN